MKKVIIGIVAAIVVAYGVMCIGNEMRVNRNTRNVAAYVHGAQKNGAITADECRVLIGNLHYCVWVPAWVRTERAEQVRRIVRRAYQKQQEREAQEPEKWEPLSYQYGPLTVCKVAE